MRALLVGCGMMASGWVESIRDSALVAGRVEIVGLVDTDADQMAAFAAKQGLDAVPQFADLGAALLQTKPDVVFDITPPVARDSVVRAALAAGAHVLSEKPMANSMREARALIDVATEHNRLFVVTQNRRYSPGIRRAAAFLRAGGIGTVTGLHADFFLGPHFGGFRDEMDHVLLLDMSIHTFDGARFLAGEDARTAYCVETNPTGSWYAHGASAFATFQMEKGAVFTYRGSWCAEGAPTAWDSSWRITGSNGTLLWDGEEAVTARTGVGKGPATQFFRETEEQDVPPLPTDQQSHGHASVISEFVDAVAAGTRPETDCTDNINSIAMVFAAIESAQSGRQIALHDLENAA